MKASRNLEDKTGQDLPKQQALCTHLMMKRTFILQISFLIFMILLSSKAYADCPAPMTGNNTIQDPCIITTCAMLQNLSLDLAGHYALGSDINCADTISWNSGAGFMPIGTYLSPFLGTLDGKNHTITGLHINRPTTNEVGLFGCIRAGSSIHNLGLEDVNITGQSNVGSLVGFNGNGDTLAAGEAYQVYAKGNIRATNSNAGGIYGSGAGNQKFLYDSYFVGNVTAATRGAGGIVGAAQYGRVNNSYAAGSVNSANVAGGIYGDNYAYLTASFSTASISGVSAAGIVGSNTLQWIGDISSAWYDHDDSATTCINGWQAAGCTMIDNTTGLNYFFNATNTPMNTWDFTNVWQECPSGYPVLKGQGVSGCDTIIGSEADDIYPTFTGYYDENGTHTGYGYSQFSVFVANTNETVYLEILGVNHTADNDMFADYFTAWVNLTNGTYSYRWYAYGNGTSNNLNYSGVRYYTILDPPTCPAGIEGNCSIASPCMITNCNQLQQVRSGNYALANDIDCSQTRTWNEATGFLPIGTSSDPFTGNFDGRNHTIKGLFISRNQTDNVGLFASIIDSSIANIRFNDSSVTGSSSTGVLAGSIDTSTITNVHSKNSSVESLNSYGGGIIGYVISCTLDQSSTTDSHISAHDYAGGIAGRIVDSTTVKRSYSTRSTIDTIEMGAGGLVGRATNSRIEDSYAINTVNAVQGAAGGVSGELASVSKKSIVRSYSSGNINGSLYTGGITGKLVGEDDIDAAFSSATISGSYIGGIAGYAEFDLITQSYWKNSSSVPVCTGYDENPTGDNTCYAAGSYAYFYDYGNAPYNLWNFTGVWSSICNNTGYPTLQWQGINNTDDCLYDVDTDSDGDGISDDADNIEGNISDALLEGISSINMTVNGSSGHDDFDDVAEVAFYDASEKIVNFTFNFSASTLNLSQVRIIVTDTSIIVNLSGQLEIYNKTIYMQDQGFSSLCVKDAEIASINDMSASCDGANETDFTTCISSSVETTIGGITCKDLGSTIEISGLRHSAIRGTPITATTSTSTRRSGHSGATYNAPYCGNLVCNQEENCYTCPKDCGSCNQGEDMPKIVQDVHIENVTPDSPLKESTPTQQDTSEYSTSKESVMNSRTYSSNSHIIWVVVAAIFIAIITLVYFKIKR